MSKKLVVKKSVKFNAEISNVWEALTNPEITKKYFFNCEAISDWKVGSPIIFKMTSDGKEIVAVKGIVTAIEQERLLEHTCFASEFENVPSKHTTVTYKLSSENDITKLSVTQGDFGDEETYNHTDASWNHVLNGLKMIIDISEESVKSEGLISSLRNKLIESTMEPSDFWYENRKFLKSFTERKPEDQLIEAMGYVESEGLGGFLYKPDSSWG